MPDLGENVCANVTSEATCDSRATANARSSPRTEYWRNFPRHHCYYRDNVVFHIRTSCASKPAPCPVISSPGQHDEFGPRQLWSHCSYAAWLLRLATLMLIQIRNFAESASSRQSEGVCRQEQQSLRTKAAHSRTAVPQAPRAEPHPPMCSNMQVCSEASMACSMCQSQ